MKQFACNYLRYNSLLYKVIAMMCAVIIMPKTIQLPFIACRLRTDLRLPARCQKLRIGVRESVPQRDSASVWTSTPGRSERSARTTVWKVPTRGAWPPPRHLEAKAGCGWEGGR